MIYYLDTSPIVAALTTEDKTADAQVWISSQRAGSMAITDWVVTEFSSALSIKIRTGQIDIAERATALSKFKQLVDGVFVTLPLRRLCYLAAGAHSFPYSSEFSRPSQIWSQGRGCAAPRRRCARWPDLVHVGSGTRCGCSRFWRQSPAALSPFSERRFARLSPQTASQCDSLSGTRQEPRVRAFR